MSAAESMGNIGPFGRWDQYKSVRTVVNAAMARLLLERNQFNRVISAKTVRDYAWEMANGRWKFNGEAIVFSEQGVLLDGQHRLLAIIEAARDDDGFAVEILIVLGIDPATFPTYDQGRVRTRQQVRDLYERDDEVKSLSTAATNATALIIFQYEAGVRSFYDINYRPYSTGELMDFIDQRPGLVESANFGQRKAWGKKKAGIRLYPKVGGSLHYLCGRKDESLRDFFFMALESGVGLDESSPIYVLREKLSRLWDNRQHKVNDAQLMFQYSAKAWNALRENKSFRALRPELVSVRGGVPRPADMPTIV